MLADDDDDDSIEDGFPHRKNNVASCCRMSKFQVDAKKPRQENHGGKGEREFDG